ncbi:class I SAM-dependent methyltransferase [Streptomyces sp. NPDC020096]
MRRDMGEHYEELADTYEENWAYSPAYVQWMAAQITTSLALRQTDRFADVGCGTGLFSREIAWHLLPQHPLLCVDPSAAMLKQVEDSEHLMPVQASAEDLAAQRIKLPYAPLDAVLVKEAIHHVADTAQTVAGLAGLLGPEGRLLVVMLPPTIEYPLFDQALARYEALQPDPAAIADHMTAAGLHTSMSFVEHQVRLPVEKYLSMVRARYMSVLSTFAEEEIEAGIRQIRDRHSEAELSFPDRFVFLLGRRHSDSPSRQTIAASGGAL